MLLLGFYLHVLYLGMLEFKRSFIRPMVDRWDSVLFCTQETKMESYVDSLLRDLRGPRLDSWEGRSAVGASGVVLVGWNSS